MTPRCGLVPGGVSKKITASQAAALLGSITPADAVAAARRELATEFVEDLRRVDAQMRETRRKLATAVKTSGTTLTEVFGVGPVIAAAVIGDVREVSRFPGRDHFAAYNGTAPIEVSSGKRKVHRLSRRGNRRLNHAIHMAAVTQIRNPRSEGHAYFGKKLAQGKTRKEALRPPEAARQRRRLRPPPSRRPPGYGPRREPGNDSVTSVARLTPNACFRASHSRARHPPYHPHRREPGSLSFPRCCHPAASGQPGQGPGAARPHSGAPGVLDPAAASRQ